ncbi:hypothetical protein GCM10025777_48650 [Membranihabitans marinus]
MNGSALLSTLHEVLGDAQRHLFTQLGEAETIKPAIKHPVRVMHFAVAHQMDCSGMSHRD